jgi:hypothetical protein
MILGGALVLACGGSDEAIFGGGSPDASAGGSGARGGNAGNGGSAGANGANGASGSSGRGGSGGSGVSDAPADGGSTGADSATDSATDAGDATAGSGGTTGSGGATDGGGTDSGVGIGGPGKVVCGDTACDLPGSQCCLGFPIFGCQPVFPPICIVSAQLNCDDALDCENAQTCCATVASNNITSSNCREACRTGEVVVCNDSTRCPATTTCKPFTGLEHYRTCAPP